MAKGIGLMIAIGKKAGPPPRYKATPDAPSMKESPRPAPSEKGGDPAPNDPDAGRPEQDVVISPEAVLYHGSEKACSKCEYFEQGGQCRVLKMTVDPEGDCMAFESKATDMDVPDPEEMSEREYQ